MNTSEALWMENLLEKGHAPEVIAHFMRACAVEMHVEMSQELFFAEVDRKYCRKKNRVQFYTPHFITICYGNVLDVINKQIRLSSIIGLPQRLRNHTDRSSVLPEVAIKKRGTKWFYYIFCSFQVTLWLLWKSLKLSVWNNLELMIYELFMDLPRVLQ